MIKKIAIPLFLLTISYIVYLMVTETIERTLFSQQKIMRIDNDPFLKSSLSYLTPEGVNNLKLKYKIELIQLDHLKLSAIVLISFCGILLLAIIAFKPDFSVKKFDAIKLMVAYILLLFTIFGLFKIFIDGQFEEGNNATNRVRISIVTILLIITPLIFFTTFKMNKLEIGKNMHQAKWITNLAIVLTIISGLIALVIGIGILLTPDISSFKN
jgi:hypothetical protein